MVDRSVAVHNAVYQLVRNLDTVGYLCRDDLLAAEPCHFNGLVCGYDDTVALLDLLGGEDILCAAGAVRLHLDGDTEPLSRLFERFRRHVGMRDTGGAGGNCEYSVAALRGSRRGCRRLVRVFLPFSRVNSRQEALLAVSRQ